MTSGCIGLYHIGFVNKFPKNDFLNRTSYLK